MFEEPRFVPAANMIELPRSAGVDHLPRHHDGLISGEDQALHKVTSIRFLHLLLECLHHLVQRVDRCVVQLDEPLAGDDLYLDTDQEAQSSITPGNRVEEVGVILRRASDDRAICQDQLETLANVLKQTINMAACLNPSSHHQPAHREIVKFWN